MQQDWKTVTIGNPALVKKNQAKEIIAKKDLSKSNINSSVKLDENDEVIKIKTVPRETANLIVAGRINKKLTRKQLANNLNLKEAILEEIETGKAIYDGNLIAKIKKYLSII
jgi:ribosome-binding protein aMBF1 (putative translation factor)